MNIHCDAYEMYNNKTNKCKKCPKGYIVRNAYYRTVHNRPINGRKSVKKSLLLKNKKQTFVKATCIKSRGLPGKTTLRFKDKNTGKVTGIGILKKGELGRFGYHHVKSLDKNTRHTILKKIVRVYGAKMIVRKLGAIRTYLKNTSPLHSHIFYEDQKWVRKYFSDQFKGNYKNSKLYNNHVQL